MIPLVRRTEERQMDRCFWGGRDYSEIFLKTVDFSNISYFSDGNGGSGSNF